jgi:hypothetical protein
MPNERVPRRVFLLSTVGAATVVPMAAVFAGCGKRLDCTDTSALSGEEITARNAIVYVNVAADPARRCENCALYVRAPAANECGGCTLAKGPISPAGSCAKWAQTAPKS